MPWPRYVLERARANLLQGLRRHLDQPALGLCTALLLGERADLSPAIREAFATTGVGHLLAVSGLHMGLVALFTGGLMNWILLRSTWLTLRLPVRKVATLVALTAAVLYAAMAGFSPSAVRAMVMVLAFGSAFLIDRPQTPVNALALAAWGLLLAQPLHIFGISFQLSFVAVFFLVLAMPVLQMVHNGDGEDAEKERKGMGRRDPRRLLFDLLLVTLVATVATAPLLAWHFQRISLIGVLTNLILVPVSCLVIFPSLLTSALLWPLIPPLAGIMWETIARFINPLTTAIEGLASWPLAAVWVARPSVSQIVLTYLFLSALAVLPGRSHTRVWVAILGTAILVGTGWQAWSRSHDRNLSLHVLDVGQGACQVVEFPGGGVMVADGGGLMASQFDVGKMVVAPFLRARGHTRIDILVATHPEQDHVGGLAALVEQFEVDELWTTEDEGLNTAWGRLLSACAQNDVPRIIWQKEDHIRKGPVTIDVLPPTACPEAQGNNARSLVLGLHYGKRRFLISGDIDQGRERCLLVSGLGRRDVLVVPHHGSKTSSLHAFVESTRPEVVIVPVGWRNPLGLPNGRILRRYEGAGSRILRTDQDGTVTVRTDGERVEVSKFRD